MMAGNRSRTLVFLLLTTLVTPPLIAAVEVPHYSIHEVAFEGPSYGPTDAPARDVTLVTHWRHESSDTRLTVHGFWDGDGRGGAVSRGGSSAMGSRSTRSSGPSCKASSRASSASEPPSPSCSPSMRLAKSDVMRADMVWATAWAWISTGCHA